MCRLPLEVGRRYHLFISSPPPPSHLSSSKLPKKKEKKKRRGWGLIIFLLGLRAFTCSPTASLAWSALLSKSVVSIDARDGKGSAQMDGWARTTVSVTYGVGTHPRGGRGAPAEKFLHNNPSPDTLRLAGALSIRRVGDVNIFLSIRSVWRAPLIILTRLIRAGKKLILPRCGKS